MTVLPPPLIYADHNRGERNMGVPTSVLFMLSDLLSFSSVRALLTPKSAILHTNGLIEVTSIFSGLISLWNRLFSLTRNANVDRVYS